jgi:hypothetical protein
MLKLSAKVFVVSRTWPLFHVFGEAFQVFYAGIPHQRFEQESQDFLC